MSSSRRRSPAMFAAVAFLVWLALCAIAFRGTNSTFLRAESGWYQMLAHSDAATRAHITRLLLTQSYHGHYTPLAFLVEFKLSEWIGPVAAFWKWRQIAAVAAIATVLFVFVASLARRFGARPVNGAVAGAAITSVLVFQPEMRDLVAWPFMIMQLGWILCSLVSLASLVQVAAEPQRKRWIWLAVASAYASMHLLGLGIVTVLATGFSLAFLLVAVTAGKLPQFRPVRRHLWGALAALLAAAGAHAACMLIPFDGEQAVAATPLAASSVLGCLVAFLFAAVRGLFTSPQAAAGDALQALHALWPLGLLLILGFAVLIARNLRAALQTARSEELMRLILYLFSTAVFCGLVILIAVRLSHDPAVSNVNGFLTGSRYLIPASFGLAGSALAFTLPLIQRTRAFGAILFVALAVETLVAQRVYVTTTYRTAHPLSRISHRAAWRSLETLARECRAANLPIPNVPLGRLTQEFYDWDLQTFEPLLREELHLEPNEQLTFVPWTEVRVDAPEYAARAPSLRELVKQLKLSPEQVAHGP